MSGYQPGRRGPNVSQYIAGLNQIPQESDLVQDDSYNFEDDLALFTNTEFIHNDIIDFGGLDFDFNQSIPGEEDYLIQTPVIDAPLGLSSSDATSSSEVKIANKRQKLSPGSSSASVQPSGTASANQTLAAKSPLRVAIPTVAKNTSTQQQTSSSALSAKTADGTMNFDGDFDFGNVGFTPQGNIINHNLPYATTPTQYNFDIPPQSPYDPKHQLNTPVTTPPNGQQGRPIVGVQPDSQALLEITARAAAEEDKRRRNTAASARFRHKKKQREQALERSAKDMTDKLDKLEEKITQLEKENQWLRSLVVEKTAKTKEEMAELYKTFKEEDRSKDMKKRGIGTAKFEN